MPEIKLDFLPPDSKSNSKGRKRPRSMSLPYFQSIKSVKPVKEVDLRLMKVSEEEETDLDKQETDIDKEEASEVCLLKPGFV